MAAYGRIFIALIAWQISIRPFRLLTRLITRTFVPRSMHKKRRIRRTLELVLFSIVFSEFLNSTLSVSACCCCCREILSSRCLATSREAQTITSSEWSHLSPVAGKSTPGVYDVTWNWRQSIRGVKVISGAFKMRGRPSP